MIDPIDLARSLCAAAIVTVTTIVGAMPLGLAIALLVDLEPGTPIYAQGPVGIGVAVVVLAACYVVGRFVGAPLANRFQEATGGEAVEW